MFNVEQLSVMQFQGNRVAEWAINSTNSGVQEGVFISQALTHYLGYFGFTTDVQGFCNQMNMAYAQILSLVGVRLPMKLKR